jgi:hypothetical protein
MIIRASGGNRMNEKLYRTISVAGIWSLVMGIITIVTGIATGTMLLITSAKLLKGKKDGLL